MAETDREWRTKVTVNFCCISDANIYCMKAKWYCSRVSFIWQQLKKNTEGKAISATGRENP
jgi:hypothetical protein